MENAWKETGRRKIYVRNKCVNMSDTTFLPSHGFFYFTPYMLQFSFGVADKKEMENRAIELSYVHWVDSLFECYLGWWDLTRC